MKLHHLLLLVWVLFVTVWLFNQFGGWNRKRRK